MNLSMLIGSAFLMGILGSGHCAGMCGGIAALAGYATNTSRAGSQFSCILCFNLGRLFSYTSFAVCISLAIRSFEQLTGFNQIGTAFEILAASLLCITGIHLTGWFKSLHFIERQGQRFWKKVMPIAQKLLPIKSYYHAFLLGILWGWLPCGLLYSALSFSALSPSPIYAGLTMFSFGLGTLPSMLTAGYFSSKLTQWIKNQRVRTSLGLGFLCMGGWSTFRIFALV